MFLHLIQGNTWMCGLISLYAMLLTWFFTRQSYYEHREKCGRLLACIAKGSTEPPTISSLKSPSGSHTSDPQEILNTFCSYYIIGILNSTYWGALNHHTLVYSDIDWKYIDRVQHLLCCYWVISSFQLAKSPGSDGLPIDFYKEYAEFVAPSLLKVYLTAF